MFQNFETAATVPFMSTSNLKNVWESVIRDKDLRLLGSHLQYTLSLKLREPVGALVVASVTMV